MLDQASLKSGLSRIRPPVPRKTPAIFSIINRFFTVVIVTAMLILGGYGAGLFLAHNDPGITEIQVPTLQTDGIHGQADPTQIRQAIVDATSLAGGPLIRDASRPLWLLIQASRSAPDHSIPTVFDIRSVQTSSHRFWLVSHDRSMPAIDISASARTEEGVLYIKVPAQPAPYDLVGALDTPFLFKPKVLAWRYADATVLAKHFTANGVALWAILLGMAAFSLCVAVVNRSFLFLVFSAWLIASIRVACFNNGWDFGWLGTNQWDGIAFEFLKLSLAAYAFLSAVLFNTIFARTLAHSLVRRVMSLWIFGFGLLIALGAFLPLDVYMTMFRVLAVAGILTLGTGLIKVLSQRGSITAWVYAASYGIWITGMLAEVLFQAHVLPGIENLGINATGGALASAIVMGVALAAQIREERSARLEAQKRELNVLKELKGVYSRTPVGLFSIDSTGRITSSNPAFRQMFHMAGKWTSSPAFLALWQGGLSAMCKKSGESEHQVQRRELHIEPEDAEPAWYLVTLARSDTGFDGSVVDMTARKLAEQQLEHIARHDSVTDALNARAFEEEVAQRIQSREPGVIGEVALDRFDYFRKIHGRRLSDALQRRIVSVLQTALPACTIGVMQDRFFILQPDNDVLGVQHRLETLFSTLDTEGFVIGFVEIPASLRAGLCVLGDAPSPAELMLRTNVALEMTVDSSDNRTLVADENESDVVRGLTAARVAGGIEDYIRDGRFYLVAQPIVDLEDPRARPSFELLLRMRGESGEMISPAQFVPVAEKTGVMNALDRFVLQEGFRLVTQGHLDMEQIDHLSLNLSGSSLNDLQFLTDIYEMVTSTNVDMRDFCFEVTESVALNNFARARDFLAALQQIGAKTAIDDFGAGHSSIHYLAEFNPDYLKIDGSLTTKLLTHPIHKSFVQKMASLASEMNVDCVGEFVESEELETALRDLGIRYGQGYHYAAPMAIEQVSQFCADWATRNALKTAQSPGEHAR